MLKIQVIKVSPFEENCRLLFDENKHEAVVCDPGDNAQAIENALESLSCRLKAILVTHGHLDHIGAVQALSKLTGTMVLGPQESDDFLIKGIEDQAHLLGLKKCESFTPHYLKDGEYLSPFSDPALKIKVIATPGHTPGGVCFYFEAQKLLLSGDTIFYGSVGRSDLPGGDENTLINSVRKILTLPKDTRICPGHGPDTSVEFERRYNPYAD